MVQEWALPDWVLGVLFLAPYVIAFFWAGATDGKAEAKRRRRF